LTIPLREIKFDQIIGCGRFSDVYQVDHFGTVAMKLPRMDHIEEDKRVEVFKQEVACYQNVRHENLVFFCGYTLDPSKLGIILERIRGPSLYTFLHESSTDNALDFNDAVDYAKQICQVCIKFLGLSRKFPALSIKKIS
jgi:serine/threonine protein kinase